MSWHAPNPSIVITIGVESSPVVMVVAQTQELEARIRDWVRSQDDLSDLVQRALDLHSEARA